jgi:Uma2 family endonuclease
MAVELKRHRFSRADYHHMAKVGIIRPDARVELIDGEIIEMSPIGRRHKAGVDRANREFTTRLDGRAIVRVQSSVALGGYGEPEPDLTILRYRADYYAESDEALEDILLIVEVADTSEVYDRQTKGPLYARFGIREYWLVDLNRECITQFRDPAPDGYATTRIFRRGESLSPLAFPEVSVPVAAILG